MIDKGFFSRNKAIVWVLVFAFLLRLAIFILVADQQMFLDPDSGDYLQLSDSIATNFEYSRGSDPEIFRAPGYPLFLALYRIFSNSIIPVILTQIILDSAICLLVWKLSLHIIKNNRIAVVAAIFHAISVSSIVFSMKILSETLLTFSLLSSLLLLEAVYLLANAESTGRKSMLRTIASSLLCGAACLLRAAAIPLVPLFAVHVWRKTRRTSLVLLFVLAPSLAVGGWCLRNYYSANYKGYCSVGAVLLYRYNACALLAKQNNRTFDEQLTVCDSELSGKSQREQAEFAKKEGLRIVLDAPFSYGLIHLKADVNNLLPAVGDLLRLLGFNVGNNGTLSVINSRGIVEGVRHYFNGRVSLLFLCIPAICVIGIKYLGCLLGIYYLIKGLIRKRFELSHAYVLFAITLTYFLFIPGPASHPRFRVPAEPLIAMIAAYGLLSLLEQFRTKQAQAAADRSRKEFC